MPHITQESLLSVDGPKTPDEKVTVEDNSFAILSTMARQIQELNTKQCHRETDFLEMIAQIKHFLSLCKVQENRIETITHESGFHDFFTRIRDGEHSGAFSEETPESTKEASLLNEMKELGYGKLATVYRDYAFWLDKDVGMPYGKEDDKKNIEITVIATREQQIERKNRIIKIIDSHLMACAAMRNSPRSEELKATPESETVMFYFQMLLDCIVALEGKASLLHLWNVIIQDEQLNKLLQNINKEFIDIYNKSGIDLREMGALFYAHYATFQDTVQNSVIHFGSDIYLTYFQLMLTQAKNQEVAYIYLDCLCHQLNYLKMKVSELHHYSLTNPLISQSSEQEEVFDKLKQFNVWLESHSLLKDDFIEYYKNSLLRVIDVFSSLVTQYLTKVEEFANLKTQVFQSNLDNEELNKINSAFLEAIQYQNRKDLFVLSDSKTEAINQVIVPYCKGLTGHIENLFTWASYLLQNCDINFAHDQFWIDSHNNLMKTYYRTQIKIARVENVDISVVAERLVESLLNFAIGDSEDASIEYMIKEIVGNSTEIPGRNLLLNLQDSLSALHKRNFFNPYHPMFKRSVCERLNSAYQGCVQIIRRELSLPIKGAATDFATQKATLFIMPPHPDTKDKPPEHVIHYRE